MKRQPPSVAAVPCAAALTAYKVADFYGVIARTGAATRAKKNAPVPPPAV